MKKKSKMAVKVLLGAWVSLLAGVEAGAARVDIYPQSFDAGGWGLDVQLMDVIGSPYLISHGRGIRASHSRLPSYWIFLCWRFSSIPHSWGFPRRICRSAFPFTPFRRSLTSQTYIKNAPSPQKAPLRYAFTWRCSHS